MNVTKDLLQLTFPNLDFKNLSIEFDHISIDSRSMQNGNQTLFFCLKGKNNDGHLYINQLIDEGVKHFFVESIPTQFLDKVNFYLVENSLIAFQKLAETYKNQFTLKTIAITGSSGKTIVKEWLNFLLSPENSIVRSPKSYNSQVGVPLSVFGINEHHDLGIFEAGISLPHEMDNLEQILKPHIGIFTSINEAHEEGFDSFEQKISEKFKLFKNCSSIIVEKCIETLPFINEKCFTWSFQEPTADVFVKSKIKNEQKTFLEISFQEETHQIIVPFTDNYSLQNTISCISTLLLFNYNWEIIKERIKNLYPVNLRLQTKKGINNSVLVDDSYSSDYQSLRIALDFFEQQKIHSKKTVILSDVFQSGLDINQLYKNVAKTLSKHHINRIIIIGEVIGNHLKDLPNCIAFPSTHLFLQQFNTQSFSNESILIKGARSFNFDEIVVLLEEKKHETILEINLDAITHNLNFYKSKLNANTKIMVMVKAFGYGNGGFELVKHLEYLNVDYLGVAFADEGIELRKAGIKTPIMVLNPDKNSFKAMIAYQLEPEIYSINVLQHFLEIAKEKSLNNYPIHIKWDTGMHRLGFEWHQKDQLIELLKHNNLVEIKSQFSHLASSDDKTKDTFNQKQFELFEKCTLYLNEKLGIDPLRHILNTSGIFNYSNHQYNMVRLGIGIYGLGNAIEERENLENVSTLKSVISQIRIIKEGEGVSYNRKYITTKQQKIATIPIGYADGIKRNWGTENGHVLIHNQKALIVGTICMDMLMVDVTEIDCLEGDEVIIFGKQIPINEIANRLNTISYEILTSISQRVKRIFYKS